MSHEQLDIVEFRKEACEWAATGKHFGPQIRYDNGFSGWCLTLTMDTVRMGTEKVPWKRVGIMANGDPPNKYLKIAQAVKGDSQHIADMTINRH